MGTYPSTFSAWLPPSSFFLTHFWEEALNLSLLCNLYIKFYSHTRVCVYCLVYFFP